MDEDEETADEDLPDIKQELMNQEQEAEEVKVKLELQNIEMVENSDPQHMGDSLVADKTNVEKKENFFGPPRSTCKPRSRDPRRCQKHFREMIGKHEVKNEELEKREGDLRQRLEMLECSMPAVMVWNIWRMSQGAPVPSIRRVVEKQFQGFASGTLPCPSTPSQHYDCRVREVEAERKQAQRKADEARALWTEKELALEEQKRKLEDARKIQALHKERIEKLTVEVQEMRKAREEEKAKDSCETGECGEIKCRQMWLGDSASTTSVKSTDLECLARLQDLAEAELCKKRHIAELERREETYMRTLQQADELWSKMESDAASTMSGLQEQLDLKTSANQQLVDKVRTLEDAMEKMNERLANCKNELGKFVGIEHLDAMIGSDDAFAPVADKETDASAIITNKDTMAARAAVMDRDTLAARAAMMDKDTSVRAKMMDQSNMSQQEKMVDKDTMAEMLEKHPSTLSDTIDGDFESDSDSEGEPCAPGFVCNDVVFSPTGMEDVDPGVEYSANDFVSKDKMEPKDSETKTKFEGREFQPVTISMPIDQDDTMTTSDKPESVIGKYAEKKNDQIVVPRMELKSWLEISTDVREQISVCSNCSAKNDEVKKLAKSIKSYLQVEENVASEKILRSFSKVHEISIKLESGVEQDRTGTIEHETISFIPGADLEQESDEDFEMAADKIFETDLLISNDKTPLKESEKAEEAQAVEAGSPTIIGKLSSGETVQDDETDGLLNEKEVTEIHAAEKDYVNQEREKLFNFAEDNERNKEDDGESEMEKESNEESNNQEKIIVLENDALMEDVREKEQDAKKEAISKDEELVVEVSKDEEDKEKLSDIHLQDELIKDNEERKKLEDEEQFLFETTKEKDKSIIISKRDELVEGSIISGEELEADKDREKEFSVEKLLLTEDEESVVSIEEPKIDKDLEKEISVEKLQLEAEEVIAEKSIISMEETKLDREKEMPVEKLQMAIEEVIVEDVTVTPTVQVDEKVARKESEKELSQLEKEVAATRIEKGGEITPVSLLSVPEKEDVSEISKEEKSKEQFTEKIPKDDFHPMKSPREIEGAKQELLEEISEEKTKGREESVCVRKDVVVSRRESRPRPKLIIIRRTISRRPDQVSPYSDQTESTTQIKKTKLSYIKVKDESIGTVVSVGLQTEKVIKRRSSSRKMREQKLVESDSTFNSSCILTDESLPMQKEVPKKHKESIESESKCYVCKKVISSKNAVHVSSNIQESLSQKMKDPKSEINICCTCKEQDSKSKIQSKEKIHPREESKRLFPGKNSSRLLPTEIFEETKVSSHMGISKKLYPFRDKKDKSCLVKLIRSKIDYRERKQSSDSDVKQSKKFQEFQLITKSNHSDFPQKDSISFNSISEKTSSMSSEEFSKREKQLEREENRSCHCHDSD